ARNVAQLRDPHTVTLYDFGRTSTGLFYMIFEFIDGQTLKFAADHNHPIDQKRIVAILRKILSSLEEAHQLGMLHRDVKPANIMLYDYLGRTDQVKVLDFGISKALLHNASVTLQNLTGQHLMMGTPRYMSPEQLHRESLDRRSD
ncbi:MAG: serine/threonine protein kinase, partial [Bradymonadaceae bacterium]